jgi:hypothetical protein
MAKPAAMDQAERAAAMLTIVPALPIVAEPVLRHFLGQSTPTGI